MRAQEFLAENDKNITITVPINITIPAGGGDPTVNASPSNDKPPVMVPPLQQHIELAKSAAGKTSDVIDQIVTDNGANSEEAEPEQVVAITNTSTQRKLSLHQRFSDLQAKLQQALSNLG